MRWPGIHVRGAPDLVIEVASKGTRKRDETIKRRLYERAGVTSTGLWTRDRRGARPCPESSAGRLAHVRPRRRLEPGPPLLHRGVDDVREPCAQAQHARLRHGSCRLRPPPDPSRSRSLGKPWPFRSPEVRIQALLRNRLSSHNTLVEFC
jgi:hypothetical protein